MILSANIEFLHPAFFGLLLLIPLAAVYWIIRRKQRFPGFTISSLGGFNGYTSIRGILRSFLLPILRACAFIFLVTALARPQAILKEEDITAEGIDIALVMDISSSMLARDFEPDRLEASKQVAIDFVEKRQYDRMSLAVFAGEAFTQSPLTTDHGVITHFLDNLRCGILEDGTAMGMGLATAVSHLKDSESKTKVIVLLTDGVNNSGYIQPITAAEMAREFGMRVYTIGVGSTGQAYAPIGRRGDGKYSFGYVNVEIDEALLRKVSEMTDGKYYRATNMERLQNIYDEIDQLEKTKIEVTTIKRSQEVFHKWVMLALLFLLIEIGLRYTILKTVP